MKSSIIKDFIHNENAYNYITGITKENKIDIIKAKYDYKIIDAIDDIAVRIKFEELKPYFYCYKGKMLYTTDNFDIAIEWKNKGKKVRRVSGEHRIIAEWENRTSDHKYVWIEINTGDFGHVIFTDKQIKAIKDKLTYMNQKYKKEELI